MPRFARRSASLGSLLAILVCLSSCALSVASFFAQTEAVTERVQDRGAKPIIQPSSAAISEDSPFSFLVLSDAHFGASFAASGDVLDAFSALAGSRDKLGNPYAFVVYVGDDTDSGAQGEYESFVAWAASMKDSNGKPLQWYSAVGNHDLYDGGWARFRKYIGPSYFHLHAGAYSIYFIDTGQGTLGNYQIEELTAEFASDPKPKIIVSHYPIYAGVDVLYYYRLSNPREVTELLDLFARSNVRIILSGHWHYYTHESIGPMDEWIVGSMAVTEGGSHHGLTVTLDGSSSSVSRMAF